MTNQKASESTEPCEASASLKDWEQRYPYHHIIGCARIQRTAVLVTEYMKKRFPEHCDFLHYRDDRGLTGKIHEWQIIRVTNSHALPDEKLLIEVCRALVAGCGDYDIWA